MRVLLIAEACNPTWTSVPLVGYNLARALADRPDLDVTLVSHVRNRAALEADPIAGRARLAFIDNEWLAWPMYKLATLLRGGKGLAWTIDTAMAWPSYVLAFEPMLFQRFARPLHDGRYDLIHRVTPLTPTIPSPLAGWTDVPMLIGPLNGGLPWPREYPELRRQEREWLVPLRHAYQRLPYYSTTYRHAAGVIAGSRHTATEIPRTFRGRRFYLPENGVDPVRFPLASDWPEPKGRFRFLTVGRLVPYKGADLTLEAIRDSEALRRCEFRIAGDGPQRPHLEALVKEWHLEDCVKLLGWTDQTQLAEEFRRAQAFAFPSLREFGGGVVVEAMASALPAIIVDYGGPAELVTPESGVLLPMAPRAELVPRLRQAMEALAATVAGLYRELVNGKAPG
jgi:glycosyltransferase involved in cell wall biosynthesis